MRNRIRSPAALAFAPDGLTVAAGGEKWQVVVWKWEWSVLQLDFTPIQPPTRRRR